MTDARQPRHLSRPSDSRSFVKLTYNQVGGGQSASALGIGREIETGEMAVITPLLVERAGIWAGVPVDFGRFDNSIGRHTAAEPVGTC